MQSNSKQLQKSTPPYKRNFYLLNNNKERFSISTQIVKLWMLIITAMMMSLQKEKEEKIELKISLAEGMLVWDFYFKP